MNVPSRDTPMLGIALKMSSIVAFALMATCLKLAADLPLGQLIFGRSFFSLIPLLIFLAMRGELVSGFKTKRPWAHFFRSTIGSLGMVTGFTALTLLPLPESNAIMFANPLFVVILSALFLKEDVRLFRWSAVVIGLGGVLIMLWPRLTVLTSPEGLEISQTIGALAGLSGALISAFAMITVRALTKTERSATIVIYFAIFTSIMSLASMPFGWVWPNPYEAALLVGAGIAGGFGQAFMTESYRHAELSTIAPFDYTSLIFTLTIGYLIFGDVPTVPMLVGAFIVIGAGLFVIWREQQRGIDRSKQRKVSPTQN